MTAQTTIDQTRLEAFLGRAVTDMAAAESAAAMYLGDRLGLYRAMAGAGPMGSEQLATATGTHERLVREWLHNQVVGGYVEHHATTGAFELPAEHAAVLADDQAPVFMGGLFDIIASMWADADRVEAAFRGDGGLDWGEHDHRLYVGVERLFAPIYRTNLLSDWIPALEGVSAKLETKAEVADVGCGLGASTLAMATAFPRSHFIGYDRHEPSIEAARLRAAAAGVADRLDFEVAEASALPRQGFDLICFLDCLHDMGDPVAAARDARRALTADGTVLLVEPRAGDTLEENHNPVSRLFYAGSIFLCTPASLAQDGREGLGAQAGPARLCEVMRQAGFSIIRVATETPFNLVLEARR